MTRLLLKNNPIYITHLFNKLDQNSCMQESQNGSVDSFAHLKNYFFDQYDSPFHRNHSFANRTKQTKDQPKSLEVAFNHRQELNMGAFEQSQKEASQFPLFYKLSHEIKESYDKLSQPQKQQKTKKNNRKNDTKNIPKNFGKGIINFIEKQQRKVKQLLVESHLSYFQLIKLLRSQKKTINTIADLRRLWTHPKFGRILRIFSNMFLRKYAIEYIFNSRISSYSTHIKYRQILWSALKNPQSFNHIKQY